MLFRSIRRDATCSRYSHDNDTIKVAASTGMNVAKWDRYEAAKALGSGSSKGTGINWTLMRYSEVLLMLAEAENELNGPSALAKEMLTKVRTRAFRNSPTFDQDVTEYVNTVSASKDKFFEAIVNERAWEFGGECIRKWDLVKSVRLACLMCAASVYPEPGSNSLVFGIYIFFYIIEGYKSNLKF